jgi:hypothetical protein
MNWIFRKLLKLKQKRILFEMKMDLKWLEAYKKDVLKANEDELRNKLAEYQDKETLDSKDNLEIDNIANILAEIKIVKQRHTQTKSNIKELSSYIEML